MGDSDTGYLTARGELGGVKGTDCGVRGDEGVSSDILIRKGWVGGMSGKGWE